MKTGFSRIVWGIFILLTAAFVLTNQLGSFSGLSVGGIIAAVGSLIIIVHSVADLNFTVLPLPLAVLYFVFHAYFGLPYIGPWTLAGGAFLAIIGLSVLLPNKLRFHKNRHCRMSGDHQVKAETQSGPNDNNPSVSVHFGAISRRLLANSLETVNLQSSFGAMEIYFDQAQLSPNGAEVFINCNFGAIELLVPRHWCIINRLTCTLGGVDDHSGSSPAENAPQLILTGRVSFGGIEIKYI